MSLEILICLLSGGGLEAVRTACAKALRQECAWNVQGPTESKGQRGERCGQRGDGSS